MAKLIGPDLTQPIDIATIDDGAMLQGHVGEKRVLLIRRGDEFFAISPRCTHYGGPLKKGLLVDNTIRCPWHHACFDLRTGKPLRAPALAPISCWNVEISPDANGNKSDGTVRVQEMLERWEPSPQPSSSGLPQTVVIIGGGAAGNAAAETLRNDGYPGRIIILSADKTLPCDRPNLSKGYLSGATPDKMNLLRSEEFYKKRNIELHLGAHVTNIDTAARSVQLADGSQHEYDALVMATGAAPVQLDIPGADLSHVHYLRTLTDSRALVAGALDAKQAVVIGASFIGLEVAASLRTRGVGVQVVGIEQTLMAKVLGPEVGNYLQQLHESHDVTFHLGTSAASIDEQSVLLNNGVRLPADLVVIGIGVRPATSLAQQAGIAIDRGVAVNEYLETNIPGIYAAGDIARWPDPFSGESIRVEHWVVAERQGQVAAHNILGRRERFAQVPFFWTEQYDFSLAHVGHAEQWDEAEMVGSLDARDCTVSYKRGGRLLARSFVGRDHAGLITEFEFEQKLAAGEFNSHSNFASQAQPIRSQPAPQQ